MGMKLVKWRRERVLGWLSVAAIVLAMLLILWAWSVLEPGKEGKASEAAASSRWATGFSP
jgi:hypothetical protein